MAFRQITLSVTGRTPVVLTPEPDGYSRRPSPRWFTNGRTARGNSITNERPQKLTYEWTITAKVPESTMLALWGIQTTSQANTLDPVILTDEFLRVDPGVVRTFVSGSTITVDGQTAGYGVFSVILEFAETGTPIGRGSVVGETYFTVSFTAKEL